MSRPPVAAAASRSAWVSIGLIEYRSRTRALIPSPASSPAAARQWCRVTPAPISVTWSSGLDRTALDPPTGKASSGPHHREVFQGHLRWAVGADFGPGVGAAQPDVRLRDGRHADEVVGAGEERGEGGG